MSKSIKLKNSLFWDTKSIVHNKKVLADIIYPVGSIYMSVNSTNPSTYYGGTWVLWGAGRVPVCINTADADFKTVEKTGGSKSYALILTDLPHGILGVQSRNGGFLHEVDGLGTGVSFGAVGTNTAAQTSVQLLQPYITCYMWKRTK